MNNKIFVLITYALIGLVIALWPILVKGRVLQRSTPSVNGENKSLFSVMLAPGSFAAVALGMLWGSGESITSIIILGCAIVAFSLSVLTGRFDATTILPAFAALCATTTIPWWRRQNGILDIDNLELLIFGLLVFVLSHLFTTKTFVKESRSSVGWLVPYAAIAAILSFSTAIFGDNNALLTLWHHWGAYIGPAELLLTGAAIFHDFPVQYGLGPTALIASSCTGDCWHGMYFITAFATWGFSVLVAALALAVSRKRWPERLAVLTLCLATCFFWTAYPPSAASPIEAPSVSGLRFLPALLLITYLFFAGQIERSKPKMLLAHCLWAMGVLWSPESAFYVTFVWWPYYIFIRRTHGNFWSQAKSIIRSAINLLSISAGLAIIFTAVFRTIYHTGPTLYGFLAYAIDPPGPMPINPHGGVWYFLSTITIAGITLFHLWRKSGDTPSFRAGFLVMLLCYAAFSYFLGRSHDNNLLNITPFILLVLLHAIAATDNKILTRISVVLVAALLGWLPLFGWEAWRTIINEEGLFAFNPKSVRDSLSFSNASTQAKLDSRYALAGLKAGSPSDAGKAIDFIQQHYSEPITVLDFAMDLVRSTPPAVWSAIHGTANFGYIPSLRKREFLYKTALHLKRSGWLVIDRQFPADDWLADFDFAYERTNRLEFGSYYALRFSPRTIMPTDFLTAFNAGHINDPRHIDTPSGQGVLVMPWQTEIGIVDSLTVTTGFSYTYDNVLIEKDSTLRFDVGMTYQTPEAARAIVTIVSANGRDTPYSALLPLQTGTGHLKFLPVSIPLNHYAGSKVSISFSVETPGTNSAGHWVAFAKPRIVGSTSESSESAAFYAK